MASKPLSVTVAVLALLAGCGKEKGGLTGPVIMAGQSIAYRIATANALGNYSRKVLFGEPATGPAKPDSQPPGSVTEVRFLAGMVEDSRRRPAAGARIRVYAVPADTLTPDRPPKPVRLLDTGLCDAAGHFRFDSLSAGSLSIVAENPDGTERAFHFLPADTGGENARDEAVGAETGAAANKAETAALRLAMQAKGGYGGRCRREGWVTSGSKADGDIQVSLEGTPFMTWTDMEGGFILQGIPPGRYTARFYAPPDGHFLPAFDSVDIRSGLESADTLKLAFNPRIRPPKPQGLKVEGRDAQGNILFQSPPIRDTVFTDTPGTAIPVGTEIFYVIRCFDRKWVPSLFAGSEDGAPVSLRIGSP